MLKLVYRDYSDFSKFAVRIANYLVQYGETDEQTKYNVRLVISELAGNIIKHSNCAAEVSLFMELDSVIINICGGNCFETERQIRLPEPDCECGRGVYIVREISESLNYYDGGTKAVCKIKRR